MTHPSAMDKQSFREVFEKVSIAQLASRDLPDEVTSRTSREEAWQPH